MRSTFLFSLMILLFSCKKEIIKNNVTISDLEILLIDEIEAQITYKLNIIGTPQIIENGIIFTTNANPEFYNQKFINTDESSNLKHLTIGALEPELNYYVQAYVITLKDTILGEIKSFKTGKYFKVGAGVTDVDGNQYETVILGNQEWMASNLSTTKFANGDSIVKFDSIGEWLGNNSPAWFNFEFDNQNDSIYAKMYNGFAIFDSRNVCPSGWHVSTEADWVELIMYLGNDNFFGGKIKSKGTVEEGNGIWKYPNAWATNSSGLNALPGGYQDFSFNGLGKYMKFGIIMNNSAYNGIQFYYSTSNVDFPGCGMATGTYIRCVKN